MAGKFHVQSLKGAKSTGAGETVYLGPVPSTALYYQCAMSGTTRSRFNLEVSIDGTRWVVLGSTYTVTSTQVGRIVKASTNALAPVFTHARARITTATTGTSGRTVVSLVGKSA